MHLYFFRCCHICVFKFLDRILCKPRYSFCWNRLKYCCKSQLWVQPFRAILRKDFSEQQEDNMIVTVILWPREYNREVRDEEAAAEGIILMNIFGKVGAHRANFEKQRYMKLFSQFLRSVECRAGTIVEENQRERLFLAGYWIVRMIKCVDDGK